VTADPWDLQRFVQAQEPVFESVRRELRRGRKDSHWMWFVFPQISGLGFSATSARYAISGLDEARAYLEHPVLGPQLRECVRLVLDAPGDAESIFGSIDAMKLRSSMTLFHHAAPDEEAFAAALLRFFGGSEDQLTLARL
jgi:uncharacterized protein (DUF1810 family)